MVNIHFYRKQCAEHDFTTIYNEQKCELTVIDTNGTIWVHKVYNENGSEYIKDEIIF